VLVFGLLCLLLGAAGAQAPATVTRLLPLRHIEARMLRTLLGAALFTTTGAVLPGSDTPALGGMLPLEITVLLALESSDTLIVRAVAPTPAAANAAIDRLGALLALIDLPMKRIAVTVMLVDTSASDAANFGNSGSMASMPGSVVSTNGGDAGALSVRHQHGQTRQILAETLAQHRGTIHGSACTVVPQGGSGSLQIADLNAPVEALDIRNATALPDGRIKLAIGPVYALNGLTLSTPVVILRDGETAPLGLYGGPTQRQTGTRPPLKTLPGRLDVSTTTPVTLLLITATVLPEETIDPFAGFDHGEPRW
jgi:hypothetical protein